MPRSFVISLPNASERRIKAALQLEKQGIDYSFFDAVDGKKGAHPLLTRFNYDKFLSHHGRPAVAGEAGCYASHYLLWQKCVELNEPIIVLEDDFVLADFAVQTFQTANSLSKKFGFIRLENTSPKPRIPVWKQGNYTLSRYLKIPQCLTCYQLTPTAARAFINASEEFIYPVDVFIRNQHIHGIPIYGLTPPAVYRSDLSNTQSLIGNRHIDKGPLWCKFTRGIYRSYNAIMNSCTNIRFIATIDRNKY